MPDTQIAESPVLKITQLDVAVRQLNAAVKLFFFDGDPCAIYTLTRNGEEIVSCLLKKKGQKSFWNQMLDSSIKPEFREKVRKMLDYPRNVLKHAIHEESTIIDFYPAANEPILLAAIQAIHLSYPSVMAQHPDLLVFGIWYRIHNPEILDEKLRAAIEPYLECRGLSKADFYNRFISIAQEHRERIWS